MGFKLQKGISLIEVVVGFAILGLVSILVASLYFAHFRLFSNQSTAIEVASQNKIALGEITNQIREGESVVDTCSNCSGDTTSDTVFVLRLWPLDATGEVFDPGTSAYDYVVYKRDSTDNTKLIKKTIPHTTSSRTLDSKIIASQVSNLQFTYDNADKTLANVVTVTLTTSAIANKKTQTSNNTTKANLRNKQAAASPPPIPITMTPLAGNVLVNALGASSFQTTQSFDPANNSLVIVVVSGVDKFDGLASGSWETPTLSGNNLTWVHIPPTLIPSNNNDYGMSVFRAMGPNPTNGQLSITFPDPLQGILYSVVQFTNVNTSGLNGAGAIGNITAPPPVTNPSTSLTLNLPAFGSPNNATYGAIAIGGQDYDMTPGNGFSNIHEFGFSVLGIGGRQLTEWRVDNDTTVNASWTSNSGLVDSKGFAIEIKAAP